MATSKRGFASMDPAKQKEIASKGGRAAHAKGTAHEFTSDEAPYVRERDYHASQKIEELPDGRIRLTMDVVIDWELQAWVMGFGPAAKVIQPAAFATRIVESLEETRATYLRTE